MKTTTDRPAELTVIRTDLGAIFVSLELSRLSWVVTSLLPGGGEKMSRHSVPGSDIASLMARFSQLREKAQGRAACDFPIIVIQEAGLDGFWIHRVLQKEGIESHVVDPASIATSRRRRRAKTDRLDGETLVRTLLAFKRGEPRVCAMVRAPGPEDEDRRRITRERKVLISERVEHVNRIKGLLFAQGISGYEPLRRDRRTRLDALRTGDGRAMPPHLKAHILRELDRLELLLTQITVVEATRDAVLAEEPQDRETPAAARMLLDIKGIGPEFAALLDLLAIKGAIVTIVVMGCQKKIAEKIIAKKADYVFGLKGNQGSLRADVELLFAEQYALDFKDMAVSRATTTDAGHGRIENRKVFATDDIDWLTQRHQWKGLRSIVMVLSTRETARERETERRYYISSLPADAEKLAATIRAHWGVENALHWVLDVNFRDDDCRIRKKNAPANFTSVKRATLNALRKAPGKDSLKSKRLIAGWDENYLAKILENI
ncbi:MAG: ISAs1 family transposase [Burkholderiaceae bacterium]|nr:ISAs1 family transposase [Burkholderiaceae bacterium]